MNHTKIAAALHALADAFLEGVESVESAVTGAKKGKGGKASPADQAAAAASALQPHVPAATAAAVAHVETAPVVAPALTISKDQLNKAVLKVAAKSRDAAEAILKRFGAVNTVTLPPEQWQAVYDAFEEEIAKQDAAAVQVAQASLV